MPPVANAADTWDAAIKEALHANEGTSKPSSLRQLYKRLAALPESNQAEESWKRTVSVIRKEGRPSPRNAKLIAEALGVPRNSLPPAAERLSHAGLDRRLQALEAEALRTPDLGPILRILRLLASGNRAEALRALSEMAGP